MKGVFYTDTLEETFLLGQRFAKTLTPGSVVAINGDLGAGKTVFIRGICSYFGITEVTSPTYTLVNEYETSSFPLYHFDLYRLEEEEELEQIGFYDYLTKQGVLLVEWAEKMPRIFQELNAIHIEISKDPQYLTDKRRIHLS